MRQTPFHRDRILGELRAKCAEFSAFYVEDSYRTAKTPFSFTCKCGTISQLLWTHVKTQGTKVLCPDCSKADRPRGASHANYNPNLLDRSKRIHLPEYRLWERSVKERANFTCQVTGQRNLRLSSHHIYNWGHYPSLRLEPSNGVCLSYDVHNRFHNIYGRGHNDYSQFCEFYLNETGTDFPGSDPRTSSC